MPNLFVYGTLKQGRGNHGWLSEKEVTFLGKAYLPNASVYGLNCGFPAVVLDTEHFVVGELYEVSDEVNYNVTRLEGYHGDGHEYNLYERAKRKVVLDDGGEAEAFVYHFTQKQFDERVANGMTAKLCEDGEW